MARRILPHDQCERIKPLLPGKAGDRGGTARTIGCSSTLCCGCFGRALHGAICLRNSGTGTPRIWHMRFARWHKPSVWQRVRATVSGDADLEAVFLDRTAIRAHLHAAGAKQNTGRSRGGWGTQVYMIADALGNPLSFPLPGAEQADITQAPTLLDAVKIPQAVIADKGSDADALVEKIESSGAPPTSSRARIAHLGASMIIVATPPAISSKT